MNVNNFGNKFHQIIKLSIVFLLSTFAFSFSVFPVKAVTATIDYSNLGDASCYYTEGNEAGALIYCVFPLTGADSYAMPNSIVVSLAGSNATSSSCFILNNSLYCNSIPTAGISSSGQKNINVVINNSGNATKGFANILAPFGPWTPSTMTTNNAIEQIYFSGTNKLYQSVRGLDNKLYTRSAEGTDSFSSWNIGTTGITIKAEPSMVVFNNLLYQSVWGTDNLSYTRYFDGTTWTGWREGNGITLKSKPSLAVFDGKVWLVGHGTDDRLYTRTILSDNVTWGNWVEGNGITLKTEAILAVAQDGLLYQVGYGTDNAIYVRTYASGGTSPNYQTTPTAWLRHGDITLGNKPRLVTNFGNKVIAVARGTDSGLYITTDLSSTPNWQRLSKAGGFNVLSSPDAIVFSGILNISTRGSDTNLYTALNPYNPTTTLNSILAGFQPSNNPWKNADGITTISSPTSTIFGNKVYQTVAGSDNKVWTRIRV